MKDKTSIVIGATKSVTPSHINYKTRLPIHCVDRNAGAVCGPTANSRAIVRTTLSTCQDVDLAHEGVFYWRERANYVADGNHYEVARWMMVRLSSIDDA